MNNRAWAWLGAALFAAAGAALVWSALPPRPEPPPPPALEDMPVAPAPAPTPPPAPPPAPTAPQAPDAGAATLPAPQAPVLAAAEAAGLERVRGERGTAYLIRILQTSRDFRVRVPAVFALGRVGSGPALAAIVLALRDPHPAVRTSAAETLGRRGDATTLPSLRAALAAEQDAAARRNLEVAIERLGVAAHPAPTPAPRPSGVRYYVAIGSPSAAKAAVSPSQLAQIELAVRSTVGMLPGVRLAPPRQDAAASRAMLEGSTMQGYYLDVAVSAFESDTHGNARATVSIMVATLPGRDLRAIVKGTAAVEDLSDNERAVTNVLQGAARSAARQLPASFERAAR